jgi:hypothetical protein
VCPSASKKATFSLVLSGFPDSKMYRRDGGICVDVRTLHSWNTGKPPLVLMEDDTDDQSAEEDHQMEVQPSFSVVENRDSPISSSVSVPQIPQGRFLNVFQRLICSSSELDLDNDYKFKTRELF